MLVLGVVCWFVCISLELTSLQKNAFFLLTTHEILKAVNNSVAFDDYSDVLGDITPSFSQFLISF